MLFGDDRARTQCKKEVYVYQILKCHIQETFYPREDLATPRQVERTMIKLYLPQVHYRYIHLGKTIVTCNR